MIQVEYANKQIVEVDERNFMLSLKSNDGNEIIHREKYKDFELIVRGIMVGEIVSHFNGYIKHPNEQINKILDTEEVENLTHCGWTGGFENAIGFDCVHGLDVAFHHSFKYLEELIKNGNVNINLHDRYSSNELNFGGIQGTFKSKEFVFDKLYKIADKALEIYNRNNQN